ncbi:MAG TPA: UvrD-helicase domain-containing protein, partial [Xanthomonadales bacterium]|nr:UvrD-helicase domain-containing protein [Xanthomonadales bacterium]
MTQFDPLLVPVRGTHLVEAGAGTGKTHGLTALVLRLLVEGVVVPEQLALVTFTDAATRELRARARTRLALLAERLAGRIETSDDEQVEALVAKHAGDADARRRVELARMTWDDATVATIHGFCRRLLGDFSLETGATFTDIEPTEGSLVLQRAVEDFWRRHVVSADAATTAWVLTWCPTPDALRVLLAEPLRVPAEQVIPVVTSEELDVFDAMLALIRIEGSQLHRTGQVRDLFASLDGAKGLLSHAKDSPYRPDALGEAAAAIAQCFAGSGPQAFADIPLEAVRALTRESIAARATKKGAGWFPAPDLVLDWAEKVCEIVDRYVVLRRVAFLHTALNEVRARLDQHRRDRRIVTFDDLVRDTAQLLDGPRGQRARDAIRARLRVAIVDEFQDTDAEQYAIFRALFHARDDGALFLIGDPKQAIYRFRGGDVFAYAQAAHDAGANRWSLTANWRSDERLIDAVNGLFDDPARMREPAFVHAFIGFERARFGEPRRRQPKLPPVARPLVVWTFDAPGTKAMPKPDIAARVEFAVAAEIARLRRELADRPLRIAVLARTWAEVQSCAAELARWRIPTTQSSTTSVFAGAEADALRIVLESLADLRAVRKARAALAGELLGYDE